MARFYRIPNRRVRTLIIEIPSLLRPLTLLLDAVLMVHLCLGSFIYRAWKEEVNSGFEKKALDKDD